VLQPELAIELLVVELDLPQSCQACQSFAVGVDGRFESDLRSQPGDQRGGRSHRPRNAPSGRRDRPPATPLLHLPYIPLRPHFILPPILQTTTPRLDPETEAMLTTLNARNTLRRAVAGLAIGLAIVAIGAVAAAGLYAETMRAPDQP